MTITDADIEDDLTPVTCYLCHSGISAATCGGWVRFVYASLPVCRACTHEGDAS